MHGLETDAMVLAFFGEQVTELRRLVMHAGEGFMLDDCGSRSDCTLTFRRLIQRAGREARAVTRD